MPRPAKIPDTILERITQVVIARQNLPTDRQLAQWAGVSVRAIQHRMMKLRIEVVSRETNNGMMQPNAS